MKKPVTVACPYCAKTIQPSLAVCPSCGHKLPDRLGAHGVPPLAPVTKELSPKSSTETSFLSASPAQETLPIWQCAWLLLTRPGRATFTRLEKAQPVTLAASALWVALGAFVVIGMFGIVENSNIAAVFDSNSYFLKKLNFGMVALLALIGALLLVLAAFSVGWIAYLFRKIAQHGLPFQRIITLLSRLTWFGLLLLGAVEIFRLIMWRITDIADINLVVDTLFLPAGLYWFLISLAAVKSATRYNVWQMAMLCLVIAVPPVILIGIVLLLALIGPSMGDVFASGSELNLPGL